MSDPLPRTQYTQEIRFAVVMYGGVSLAIYINGIAQELLRMVRHQVLYREDQILAGRWMDAVRVPVVVRLLTRSV